MRLSKRHYTGGILIEFTFSIPVCIILLFFVNDHYRLHELKNKLKSSSYLIASIIQQLKNSSTEKQLSLADFAKITYAGCLNLFHTNSMSKPWTLEISFNVGYYWVKRENTDSYKYQNFYVATAKATAQIQL